MKYCVNCNKQYFSYFIKCPFCDGKFEDLNNSKHFTLFPFMISLLTLLPKLPLNCNSLHFTLLSFGFSLFPLFPILINFKGLEEKLFVGAIYILLNPAFPNLVKIGYADDVERRIKILNSDTGLPNVFHCYAIYNVKTRLADLKIHKLIDDLNPTLRYSKNREFYEMSPEKACSILLVIAQINDEEEQLIINPFNDSYFDDFVK